MVCIRERSSFHSSVNMKTTELDFLSEVNFIILKLQTNERKGAWMVDSWMSSVSGCFLWPPSRKAVVTWLHAGGHRAHRALSTACWDRLEVTEWRGLLGKVDRVLRESSTLLPCPLLWRLSCDLIPLGSFLLTPFCCSWMGAGVRDGNHYLTGDYDLIWPLLTIWWYI